MPNPSASSLKPRTLMGEECDLLVHKVARSTPIEVGEAPIDAQFRRRYAYIQAAFSAGFAEGAREQRKRDAEIAGGFADCSFYEGGKPINLDAIAHSDAHDACHVAIMIAAAIENAAGEGE